MYVQKIILREFGSIFELEKFFLYEQENKRISFIFSQDIFEISKLKK